MKNMLILVVCLVLGITGGVFMSKCCLPSGCSCNGGCSCEGDCCCEDEKTTGASMTEEMKKKCHIGCKCDKCKDGCKCKKDGKKCSDKCKCVKK